jgi:hypothetical protein
VSAGGAEPAAVVSAGGPAPAAVVPVDLAADARPAPTPWHQAHPHLAAAQKRMESSCLAAPQD